VRAVVADRGDRRALAKLGAGLPGEPLVGGVPALRVRDPAVRLEDRPRPLVQPPLRPAPHDGRRVQPLEWDSHRGQRVAVVVDRFGGADGRQVEAAGDRDDLVAGGRLDLAPRGLGLDRQRDVLRPVVGQAGDPGDVLGGAAVVPERVLLQPQDPPAAAGRREPVGRGAADPAQPDDDRVVGPRHAGVMPREPPSS
jgi:hypothetical protein